MEREALNMAWLVFIVLLVVLPPILWDIFKEMRQEWKTGNRTGVLLYLGCLAGGILFYVWLFNH